MKKSIAIAIVAVSIISLSGFVWIYGKYEKWYGFDYLDNNTKLLFGVFKSRTHCENAAKARADVQTKMTSMRGSICGRACTFDRSVGKVACLAESKDGGEMVRGELGIFSFIFSR